MTSDQKLQEFRKDSKWLITSGSSSKSLSTSVCCEPCSHVFPATPCRRSFSLQSRICTRNSECGLKRSPSSPRCPQKALRGGIPSPVLEPFPRSWSHCVGNFYQRWTNLVKIDFAIPPRRALRGMRTLPPYDPTRCLSCDLLVSAFVFGASCFVFRGSGFVFRVSGLGRGSG